MMSSAKMNVHNLQEGRGDILPHPLTAPSEVNNFWVQGKVCLLMTRYSHRKVVQKTLQREAKLVLDNMVMRY